jgi:hypothetical protein
MEETHRGTNMLSRDHTANCSPPFEAPSVLCLTPTGVDRLAQSLLENGLADRVNARYAGRVEPSSYR